MISNISLNHFLLCQLVETYGDVSLVDMGGVQCILLSGYRGFKEAFVEQAELFADRPNYPLNDKLCKGLGEVQWNYKNHYTVDLLYSIST